MKLFPFFSVKYAAKRIPKGIQGSHCFNVFIGHLLGIYIYYKQNRYRKKIYTS